MIGFAFLRTCCCQKKIGPAQSHGRMQHPHYRYQKSELRDPAWRMKLLSIDERLPPGLPRRRIGPPRGGEDLRRLIDSFDDRCVVWSEEDRPRDRGPTEREDRASAVHSGSNNWFEVNEKMAPNQWPNASFSMTWKTHSVCLFLFHDDDAPFLAGFLRSSLAIRRNQPTHRCFLLPSSLDLTTL